MCARWLRTKRAANVSASGVRLPSLQPDSSASQALESPEIGPLPSPFEPSKTQIPIARARPPALCYLGFRTTDEGREYTLRVTSALEPRYFVLFIPHAAFAARQTRFQDAPDLCFGKLQRALAADPDLLPGERMALTSQELLDYREARERKPAGRKRRVPGNGAA